MKDWHLRATYCIIVITLIRCLKLFHFLYVLLYILIRNSHTAGINRYILGQVPHSRVKCLRNNLQKNVLPPAFLTYTFCMYANFVISCFKFHFSPYLIKQVDRVFSTNIWVEKLKAGMDNLPLSSWPWLFKLREISLFCYILLDFGLPGALLPPNPYGLRP